MPLPNPNMNCGGISGGGVPNTGGTGGNGFDESSSGVHGAYHWDCSDWARRSQNPLPNITEVPGSEVPDSSSFHSNESNESHPKNNIMPLSK